MEVAATVAEMRALRRAMAGDVGLVPTMGYLHEGPLSLVRTARRRDDHVVVSIFVNPAQFGPGEDFERYPRDPERDLALLRRERVDAVLLPSVEELYPEGDSTFVEVAGITEVLEGVHRPGHFRGVTTVVAKLFHIVQPRRAYLGRKDGQRLLGQDQEQCLGRPAGELGLAQCLEGTTPRVVDLMPPGGGEAGGRRGGPTCRGRWPGRSPSGRWRRW